MNLSRVIVYFLALSFVGLSAAIGTAQDTADTKIKIESTDDGATVLIGNEVFTNLVANKYAKPIFYPIYGPEQIGMTRNWPMNDSFKGEAHDHPHHKSLWFSHEINGIDFWSEKEGKTIIDEVVIPKVATDSIILKSTWQGKTDPKPEFTDRSVYRFGFDESSRWIDAEITIMASHGDVTFDDTKEGTFALRTHPDLRLTAKPKQGVTEVFGQALNSNGETGKTIWGKAAKWVCYGGPIDGTPMSIAIFDHPDNLRHPTTWHARDYGLVAANPFGLHYFQNAEKGAGAYTIKNGENLTLRYRALFIKGTPDAKQVETMYAKFASE